MVTALIIVANRMVTIMEQINALSGTIALQESPPMVDSVTSISPPLDESLPAVDSVTAISPPETADSE